MAKKKLQGQVAIVTGGGRGIGAATAERLTAMGARVVLAARSDEEVEAVGDVLGRTTVLSGFYSYGEISPFTPGASCKLHNQTMTITYLGER